MILDERKNIPFRPGEIGRLEPLVQHLSDLLFGELALLADVTGLGQACGEVGAVERFAL